MQLCICNAYYACIHYIRVTEPTTISIDSNFEWQFDYLNSKYLKNGLQWAL